MHFEWDETKRLRTIEEHGLDFRDARHLFDGRPIYSYLSRAMTRIGSSVSGRSRKG